MHPAVPAHRRRFGQPASSNLGTPDDALWTKSRDMLITELERCQALGIGGVAVALAGALVAIRVLRFLPTSLADEVIDPHAAGKAA